MKVEILKPRTTTAHDTHSPQPQPTFRPICTRNDAARSLGFARTTRAETRASSAHVRAPPRTQGTEGTERKGLDKKDSKILGEFCHKKEDHE